MSNLQIGQKLEVIWEPSKREGDVIAHYREFGIFIHRSSWPGRFPKPGETDRVIIHSQINANLFICRRDTTPLKPCDIITIRWRQTQSGHGLVGVCGPCLIFPKIQQVNWGTHLELGNQLSVIIVDEIDYNTFRAVPAPENFFLSRDKLVANEVYLLRFSPGHNGNVAILSDNTVIAPANTWTENLPRVGDIWPVRVRNIRNIIYVEPADRIVFALPCIKRRLAATWPERIVVKITSEQDGLKATHNGRTYEIDMSNLTEPLSAGEYWVATISKCAESEPNIVTPVIRSQVGAKCGDYRVTTFLDDGTRMLSRVSDDRVVCFPCRQHWDERYFEARDGETYAVRVVTRSYKGNSKVEFVEPYMIIPDEFIMQE